MSCYVFRVYLLDYLTIRLLTCLFTCLTVFKLFLFTCIFISVYLFVYLFACLSVYLFAFVCLPVSLFLFASLSVHLFASLPVCLTMAKIKTGRSVFHVD